VQIWQDVSAVSRLGLLVFGKGCTADRAGSTRCTCRSGSREACETESALSIHGRLAALATVLYTYDGDEMTTITPDSYTACIREVVTGRLSQLSIFRICPHSQRQCTKPTSSRPRHLPYQSCHLRTAGTGRIAGVGSQLCAAKRHESQVVVLHRLWWASPRVWSRRECRCRRRAFLNIAYGALELAISCPHPSLAQLAPRPAHLLDLP